VKIFVGIDGGGTRTTAIAVDEAGRELARHQGPAGLVQSGAVTAGAAALADLTDRVLHAAGAAPPATALCCALAGAGREADRVAIAAALQREAIAERIRVVTDADAAFHDAFGMGPGILLIAGTGSNALGRGQGTGTIRVGGWGSLLGDEGSGYALGLEALRACARIDDGRAPPSMILPMIMAELTIGEPEDLIGWAAGASKKAIAALAPLVMSAATSGDATARAIVEGAAAELVDHLKSIYHRMSPWNEPPAVALTGGLIEPGRPLREYLLDRLGRLEAELLILDRPIDAAHGAATLAREQFEGS
jgi:N-acetylglucosamine kinase-like BadF-type ATPase